MKVHLNKNLLFVYTKFNNNNNNNNNNNKILYSS